MNGFPPARLIASSRASITGSSGTANGSFTMITFRKLIPLHVDPLPEAAGAEQHGIVVRAEPIEQDLPRRALALDEQRAAERRRAVSSADWPRRSASCSW